MINQDLRWVPALAEDGEKMTILQYTFWDIELGGYRWKDVPYITDVPPIQLDDQDHINGDEEDDDEGEEWKQGIEGL